MTRRHDEPSGKWFDEDMTRCSACYLNHGHNLDKHIDSIASRAGALEISQPLWAIYGNATLYDHFTLLRKQWLDTFRHTFVLYEAAR
jgi:hypothetical protein